MLPPRIEFGSPVQRGEREGESFWHVPIAIHPRILKKIGPATAGACRIFMDLYQGDKCEDQIELRWGDYQLQSITERRTLRQGEPVLVPLVRRLESENDNNAYIADTKFHKDPDSKTKPILAGTNKKRFRLRIKWNTTKRVSPHFYLIRVPIEKSNSLFSVEIEYV